MRRGELEGRLLVLVTLGLVAFGLVMVYSATSAAAALGNTDPSAYLKRQAAYAVLGVLLLIGASRFDYRRLKALAPGLVLSSLVLCLLVLVAGTRVNGARRWLSLGPAAFQPSELAKLALAVWAAAYLARRRAPQTLRELLRPIGLLVALFGGLILLEPDLGTVIALVSRDPFGKRLAAAIVALVCGQAVINLAAVLGLAPLTGIPLPFVSYGGSSLVVQLASVGVLLNIAGGDAGARRAAVPDRGRRDGRTRPAGARRGGGAPRPRRERDVRRVAGSRRGAARS